MFDLVAVLGEAEVGELLVVDGDRGSVCGHRGGWWVWERVWIVGWCERNSFNSGKFGESAVVDKENSEKVEWAGFIGLVEHGDIHAIASRHTIRTCLTNCFHLI